MSDGARMVIDAARRFRVFSHMRAFLSPDLVEGARLCALNRAEQVIGEGCAVVVFLEVRP